MRKARDFDAAHALRHKAVRHTLQQHGGKIRTILTRARNRTSAKRRKNALCMPKHAVPRASKDKVAHQPALADGGLSIPLLRKPAQQPRQSIGKIILRQSRTMRPLLRELVQHKLHGLRDMLFGKCFKAQIHPKTPSRPRGTGQAPG